MATALRSDLQLLVFDAGLRSENCVEFEFMCGSLVRIPFVSRVFIKIVRGRIWGDSMKKRGVDTMR